MDTFHDTIDSPLGPLTIVVNAHDAVTGVWFGASRPEHGSQAPDRTAAAAGQLAEYFAGRRREFSMKLAPRGSGFQQRVWAELLRIPFGETRSYGQLATTIGGTANARAVGTANGSNPIAIIIPCHRVIGADGSLTGYGGGLPNKQWLLEHEGATVPGLFARQ